MSGPLHTLAQRSRLIAFDLESGKLVWEHGDPGPLDKPMDKTDLAGSYFLGPPLPLGGKLYVLTEKNAELRLVCLDAQSREPAWMQTLATTRDRLLQDVSRRVQAVHLSYGKASWCVRPMPARSWGSISCRAASSGHFRTAKKHPIPPCRGSAWGCRGGG